MKIHHFKLPMANQIQSLIVEPNHRWIKVLLAILVLLVVALLGLNYFRVIDLKISYLPQKSTPATSQTPLLPFSLDTCLVKKEGNPLVESISAQPTGTMGVITGKVENVVAEPVRGSSIISLVSLDGVQKYDFNILPYPGLAVIDQTNKKDTTLANIQTGQKVSLYFECSSSDNLFKFTRVSVSQ